MGGKTVASLRNRADLLKFDYTHLYGKGHRRPVIAAVTDERLRELVLQSRSWNHLAQGLGYAASNTKDTGWRPRVEARINALGLSTEHFQGRGFNGLAPLAHEPVFTADPTPERLRVAATGKAIAWFSERGYTVSLPVEPAVYDLIVDSPNGLDRIQVKSSAAADRGVHCSRTLYDTTRPGSASTGRYTRRPYEPGEIDYFFIVMADGGMYLLPYEVIGRSMKITVGARYEQFRV
ncbi:group I intron-associated PD-(D/E)XK endonuclease [Micromonospora vinacea]|uniref:group I intron-associated PD-(D/E)XK endonuclease n=1 Tax=Micromonospora vinacea TaxID=709878 RepID=UPI003D908505